MNIKGKRGTHKNLRTKRRNEARYNANCIERDRTRVRRSATDQLAALDFRLGKGVGAARERARLAQIIAEDQAHAAELNRKADEKKAAKKAKKQRA
jgi:hypothetical protein